MRYRNSIGITIIALSVIGIAAFSNLGEGLRGMFYQGAPQKPYDLQAAQPRATSMILDQMKSGKKADCASPENELAGGDKESTNMMVGQENWDNKYESYKADNFISLIPKYIAEKLGKITNETNCFFAATDFHIASCKNHIMSNTELAQILTDHYCPIKKNSTIKFGDLITVQNPGDIVGGYTKNYHHAAIVMSKNFILDKPNAGLSSVRIAPIATVYDEWAKYFKCVAPWPQNKGYQCVTVRYWRFQE